jgi:hypothetical protein
MREYRARIGASTHDKTSPRVHVFHCEDCRGKKAPKVLLHVVGSCWGERIFDRPNMLFYQRTIHMYDP